MVGRFIKNIVTVVFVLNNFIVFSQDYKGYEYTELAGYEYAEFTKSGITNKMDGNFSITTRNKKGDIITIEIKRFDKGKKTGEWITYHNLFTGLKLSFVANYKEGILNGYYFRTDNHTFSEKGFYKNNKKHGEWEFSRDGEIKKYTYKKDVKHGFFKATNEIGKISEGYYKKGEKDGKYKEVFETITKIGQYKNDLKSGIWTIQDAITGKTTKELYKNGKLISSKE